MITYNIYNYIIKWYWLIIWNITYRRVVCKILFIFRVCFSMFECALEWLFGSLLFLHSVHIVKCRFCMETCNGQTFNNVFIIYFFYLKKFLIVCCINLITLNQKIVINTKPNQYSFHSSIQIIKAIVNKTIIRLYEPTHRYFF